MSKYAALLGVSVLLIGGFWAAMTIAEPAKVPMPEGESKKKPDDAHVKFDALKKRLPGIVSVWCETSPFSLSEPQVRKPQVRIARRTSSTEAKITLVAELFGSDCFFVFYLHYYDGAWTVVRWEAAWAAGGNEITQEKVAPYMLQLALSMDESAEK